jgi:CheY-like chemotaxis protein
LKEKRVRALVVDDYGYNRDIHRLLLEREGVQVSLACNGQEALDKYVEQSEGYYDFIMMDIQMPVMDGFNAGKKMREWEEKNKWNKIDIYFVSGEYYNEAEIMVELRARGQMGEATGVRCLRKPIDVEIIKKIVQKYANIKQQLFAENQVDGDNERI